MPIKSQEKGKPKGADQKVGERKLGNEGNKKGKASYVGRTGSAPQTVVVGGGAKLALRRKKGGKKSTGQWVIIWMHHEEPLGVHKGFGGGGE